MLHRRWLPNWTRLRLAGSTPPPQRWLALLSSGLLALGLWAALILRIPTNYSGLTVGRPSPSDIQAPQSVAFISTIRTQERRAAAENRADNLVYVTDFSLPVKQRAALSSLLTTIDNLRNNPLLNQSEQEQRLINLPNATIAITPAMAQALVALDTVSWLTLQQTSLRLIDRAMDEYGYELDEQAITNLRERALPYWMNTETLTPTQRELALFFTTSFLRINRILDEAATAERRRKAGSEVEDVKIQVQEGESIVRAGEIVGPEAIEKLEATGAIPRTLGWGGLLGMGILAGALTLIFMGYLNTFQALLMRSTRALLTLIILLSLAALTARLLLPIWAERPALFPVATIALIIAVVFNGHLALASVALLSIVVGMLDNNALPLMVTLFLSGAGAIFVARGFERVRTFFLAGLGSSVIIITLQIGFWMANQGELPNTNTANVVGAIVLYGLVNGGLSAVLALGCFNLIGRAAGMITPLQLMELAHPSQPLLRKLIREAPGTYYHSVAVGNLAEAAAEAVGADALLLRVAAYYHDIGKTIRPYFFTDNQMGRENVHNELDPRTSAQIIVDHVREGIKMAQAAGLPWQIRAFIATHHGTQIIKHFYQLALQHQDSVNIADFRYPGPRPSTREQGILMLADSVEATVRSKAQNGKLLPTRSEEGGRVNGAQTIDELVASIIEDRIRDGQLDETPLTLRDLTLIRQTFATSLQSIYHPRVDYGVTR